jgi:hypothetical protein
VTREGCKSSGASEARGSGVGERRRGEISTGVGRRGEGGDSDRWGPVDREMRERRPAQEGVIRKGKHISREDATDARARWAGRDCFALRETARSVGWLGQRPNGPRGPPGQKQRKKVFELKIGFLNLSRLWKFVEGDLGGILT